MEETFEGASEISLGYGYGKIKLSISEEEWHRYRSHSCKIPDIEEIAYTLEFVPKLKPKKHDRLPSPMNLNARGLRNLKKNKNYISCPEKDDIDSDSTEGTCEGKQFSKQGVKSSNQAHMDDIIKEEYNKLGCKKKKYLEEEKMIPLRKSFCCEFKNTLNKEKIHGLMSKFSLDQNDIDSIKAKKSLTKKSYYFSSELERELDEEYNKLKSKSTPITLRTEKKHRTTSILRMLEFTIDEKKKHSSSLVTSSLAI